MTGGGRFIHSRRGGGRGAAGHQGAPIVRAKAVIAGPDPGERGLGRGTRDAKRGDGAARGSQGVRGR